MQKIWDNLQILDDMETEMVKLIKKHYGGKTTTRQRLSPKVWTMFRKRFVMHRLRLL